MSSSSQGSPYDSAPPGPQLSSTPLPPASPPPSAAPLLVACAVVAALRQGVLVGLSQHLVLQALTTALSADSQPDPGSASSITGGAWGRGEVGAGSGAGVGAGVGAPNVRHAMCVALGSLLNKWPDEATLPDAAAHILGPNPRPASPMQPGKTQPGAGQWQMPPGGTQPAAGQSHMLPPAQLEPLAWAAAGLARRGSPLAATALQQVCNCLAGLPATLLPGTPPAPPPTNTAPPSQRTAIDADRGQGSRGAQGIGHASGVAGSGPPGLAVLLSMAAGCAQVMQLLVESEQPPAGVQWATQAASTQRAAGTQGATGQAVAPAPVHVGTWAGGEGQRVVWHHVRVKVLWQQRSLQACVGALMDLLQDPGMAGERIREGQGRRKGL